ncbi:hypothetical protein B0A55_04410 [Friedmanniomyces simplex]|uniref:Uncharacterized protein n=1 Tax=Friedmanniomyces simplex TaxID=329884 RepID=A0A4U0XQ73_9PEZI|nr:hypothetical protein B0A55_04410 [Friedmanniomyces simplex]
MSNYQPGSPSPSREMSEASEVTSSQAQATDPAQPAGQNDRGGEETVLQPITAADDEIAREAENDVALVAKYGNLYAADEEKSRRKFEHQREYAAFLAAAKEHEARAKYVAQRNKIWEATRKEHETELLEKAARVERLQGLLEENLAAQEELNEEFAGDVEAHEEDKEVGERYRAYFELESDELDV